VEANRKRLRLRSGANGPDGAVRIQGGTDDSETKLTEKMRNLARRLIAEEARAGDGARPLDARAALRVCDKLRESLSPLAGARGFRTLMGRALTLARTEAPLLGKLELGENGSLSFPATVDETAPREAVEAGTVLVAHLLELLAALIGEALALRLVQQTWPQAMLED
jgi:hypothetical protein